MLNNYKVTPVTPVRDTFGIVDPATGKQYADIIKAFLELRTFCKECLSYGHITSQTGTEYKLFMDSALRRKLHCLAMEDRISVVVSFQQRTNGLFAMARIANPTKVANHTNRLMKIERGN